MPSAPERMRQSSCPRPSNQSHNAHDFETVTVYYRWHPLFRQTLRFHKRMKDRHGERIFCELPDGTICSLPAWMFQLDCLHFSLRRPMVSVAAMAVLRDLIGALRTPASQAAGFNSSRLAPWGLPISPCGRETKRYASAPCGEVRSHRTMHHQRRVQHGDLDVKRLAGDESAVASAPPPASDLARHGSPPDARRASPWA